MSVKVRVDNRTKRAKKMIEDKYEKGLKEVVFRAANYVQNEAKMSIQGGTKTGRIYQKYNPRRTHQASAAGEPPATDTGYLVNNIALDVDGDMLGASIESKAEYSAFLEFGTSKMAARPFLHPAVAITRPLVNRLLRDVGD